MVLWKKYFSGAELPIVFYYTDKDTRGKFVTAPTAGHQCFIGVLNKVRKGQVLRFGPESFRCSGAERYLGFTKEVTRPNFDNYGNFMPGYCGGIALGSWFEIDQIIEEGIDMKEHPILSFLVKENMKGLFRFAEDLGYRAPREGFVSKCDLCLDIRKHLGLKGDFKELRPKTFHEHIK